MAKRRRNRRNRRRPYRQSPNQPQPNTPKLIRNAVLGPADNNSITTTPLNRNHSPALSPIKNTDTPRVLRSNSLVLRKKINVESDGRARSNSFVTPKNIILRNDLNCTNLNQLFEEKLRDSVQKNLKYAINSNLLSEANRCKKFEEKPQNVEPIKLDVATQTVYFNRTAEEESTYHVHTFAQIFETPKNCMTEVTIFSPPPCVASSTPIEALYRPEVLANVARNMVHPKENGYNYDFTTSHKSILNKRDIHFYQSINKHRLYKTCSPRAARNAYVKINNNSNKHHKFDHPGPPVLHARKPSSSFIIPKSFTPIRRCSLEKSTQNILNVSSGSTSGRLMSRIRSFHKNHSSKWIGKLLEVCQWFGITLKMGVSKFRREGHESPVDAVAAICDCERNREKLATLETKLNQLEVNHLSQVQTLTTNLQEVHSELSRIRTELAELVSMKIIHPGGDVVLSSEPPPPPPPPPMPVAPPAPPPPPPMPLDNITPLGRGGIKINRISREDKKVDKEEARPVISLDDILKVKLKKPGERYQTPTLQRRNTQPVISMDMLRQVKLRPASRPQTPSFESSGGGGVSAASLPTSPCSSLTRLLNKVAAESNVGRVKRLQRVGAYSSDDFSRRTLHQRHGGYARRERGVSTYNLQREECKE